MAGTEHTNFTDRLLEDEQNVERLSRLTAELGQGAVGVEGERVPLRERFIFKSWFEHPAYRAAERGDAIAMLSCLQSGFDVNQQRERFGDTVLHIAATRNAKKVAMVLIESGKCDYLLRDRAGRLPSEKAYLFGENPALARLLAIKERKQAEAQRTRLARRP